MIAATLLCFASTARGSHVVDGFSFDVEQFIFSHGASSFQDDFDDGSLDPADWSDNGGTLVEASGVLTLRDPGVDLEVEYANGVLLHESSGITCEACTTLSDGMGDFSAVATWKNATFDPDRLILLGFNWTTPNTYFESLAISVSNLTAEVTDVTGIGSPGLAVGFGHSVLESFDPGNPPDDPPRSVIAELTELERVALSQITGDIVFEIAYTDDSNLFEGAYSVDGGSLQPFGATFTAPADWTFGKFNLLADPRAIPEPSSGGLLFAGLVASTLARRVARARRRG